MRVGTITEKDLGDLLTEIQLGDFYRESEKIKMTVEVPLNPGPTSVYLLTVNSTPDATMWSMYYGESNLEAPLWQYSSRDMGLIYGLVLQSFLNDPQIPAHSGKLPSAGVITGNNSVPSPPADLSKATLQGRLDPSAKEGMQITGLVQSINLSKMSGRLHLVHFNQSAQIYFIEGQPIHASSSDGVGDLAVIEIMTWEQGEFRFFPDENTDERTVKRRLDAMVMEGITLLDQEKFLRQQGLHPDAYLIRKEARISPEEFKSKLSHGAPLDLSAQMSMYEICDGRTRWKDVLSRRPMPKTEWAPLLFNLVSCGLIALLESSPFAGKAHGLATADLDHGMIANVLRHLMRADTGMYTYPALLYFLEREFGKSTAFGMPLSLIVFESRIILNNLPPQPLPIPALQEISNRVESLKRPFDILAHYETFDFALLLPGSSARAAKMIGHKVAEALINVPIMQGQTQRLLLAGGVVSAPEDTQELGKFIAAARESKNKAKEAKMPLKAFSEI